MKPQLQLPRPSLWRRELPAPGKVLVHPGDAVGPETPVAEGDLPVPPIVIDLEGARPLVTAGQSVHAGVIVAERRKLLGHGDELRSPVAGMVVKVTLNELLLQPPPLTTTLFAQLPGSIASVREAKGADVEGCYALLRGRGRLPNPIHGRLGEEIAIVAEPLTVSRLQALRAQGAQAIIAPSWADDPEPTVFALDGPPVFLTEAAPGKAMAPPIAQLLQAQLGQPAALGAGCPPLLAVAADGAAERQSFGVGSWVRLASGQTGAVISIGERPRFFPTGFQAMPAEVDLGDSTQVVAMDSLEWVA